MRIGGIFPFGQLSVPIGLAGGEAIYLPPGNYMYSLGNVTCLQNFDPVNNIWRNLAWPGSWGNVASSDGYNFRLINVSGVVQALQITNVGSGGVNGIGAAATGTSIGFGAAPTNGFAAAAYPIIGGKLNSANLSIVAGGSGYVYPPILLVDPPPVGGIQAVITCTVSGGAINAVTLQNAGAGYVTVPNVYVVPQWAAYPGVGVPVNPAGSPINATPPGTPSFLPPPMLPGINYGSALLSSAQGANVAFTGAGIITGSGTLTGAVMTSYGVGYTGSTIPTVSFSGGTLAGGVAATAVMALSVTAYSGTAGSGFVVGAPWESSLGTLVATDGCNGLLQARAARGALTATTGATASVQDPGFGLQSVPGAGIAVNGAALTATTITLTLGGVYDISVLQPAVED